MSISATTAPVVLAASSGSNPIAGFLPIIFIVALFYILMIRPQRRRMQAMRETIAAVEPGREVMTTAGVFGVVTAVTDGEIELEIAPGVRTRWAKQAIARVTPLPSEADGAEGSAEADGSSSTAKDEPDGTAG